MSPSGSERNERKETILRYAPDILARLDIDLGKMKRAGTRRVGVPPSWFRAGADGESFSVSPESGKWHDFHDGVGGDLFDLVASRFGLRTKDEFPLVLEKAEELAGIVRLEGDDTPLPEPPPQTEPRPDSPWVVGAWARKTAEEIDTLFAAARAAMNPIKWRYLFQGYGLTKKSPSVGFMKYPGKPGTIRELSDDPTPDGLVYLATEGGRPTLLLFRTMARTEKRRKRVSRPLWGRRDAFFGIDSVVEGRPVVWVGGIEKALGCMEAGYAAVSESFGEGWAKHAKTHAVALAKRNPSEVILAMDYDEAGRDGAIGRVAALGDAGIPMDRVRIVDWEMIPEKKLKPGFDVNDCLLFDATGETLKRLFTTAPVPMIHPTPGQGPAPMAPPQRVGWMPTVIRPFDDLGNGARVKDRYGDDIYYSPALDWMAYTDGKRWKRGAVDTVRAMTQIAMREIPKELGLIPSPPAGASKDDLKTHEKYVESFHKHTLRSVSTAGISNAMTELQPNVQIEADLFDANPWIFNVANGTLDLKAGTIKPHSKGDLLTKVSPVAFDPTATCPTWDWVLAGIMENNTELISFLQRALGYSLTGSPQENKLFFCYGTGRNGKSTVLETFRALCGDYGKSARYKSFCENNNETGRADLAHMRGSRFVTIVEPNASARLDEGVIKQLTGGDTISARYLYGRTELEFQVIGKFWLAANHKPDIRGTDKGIWSRVLVIPFNVFIPEEQRIPDLADKLRLEYPGILNWCLRGCSDWMDGGLKPPDIVRAATAQYQLDCDILAEFLEECTLAGDGLFVSSSDLYKCYAQWTHEAGGKPVSPKTFGSKMTERGMDRGRNNNASDRKIIYLGISLSPPGRKLLEASGGGGWNKSTDWTQRQGDWRDQN